MKLILQGKNITITAAIRSAVEAKLGSLEKLSNVFGPELLELRVEVGKPSRHHHSGPIFYAELNFKISGRLLRAEATKENLNLSISEAFAELERQVQKYKGKLVAKSRPGKNLWSHLYEFSH